MPRITWPLHRGRPRISIDVVLAGGQTRPLELLADTGAGTASSRFELILLESDCRRFGGQDASPVGLGGAYAGTFPLCDVRVCLPALAFDEEVSVVGVPSIPAGFGGLACFRFLNRFDYGNFGNPAQFGLER